MSLSIVILAAGRGKRMHSELPKVLHCLAGKPLLAHVIETCRALHPTFPPFIIYGYQGETVKQALKNYPVTWIEQTEPLGTGHAVLQALPSLPEEDQVLLLCGDVPCITVKTLQTLIAQTPRDAVGILTTILPNPLGLGRIIRDSQNKIKQIIEEKDATPAQCAIQEINSGIYLIPARYLHTWLPQLTCTNAQKEYYLTDIIPMASKDNVPIHSISPRYSEEVFGVNDRIQLALLERFYQKKLAEKFMEQGVTIYDPHRLDIRGELTVGKDVTIDVNVIIEGRVVIGNHCTIGPHTLLRNVILSDHVEIKAHSVLEGAAVADHVVIGPFARIRQGTAILSHAQIGNFIEIKNSTIGHGTKIHHVGYIGDSEVGKEVNIGAGTITCNYDGINKHKTIIEDHAFIGSNSELVAPVRIGLRATIGAGSTIRHDAPPNQLTVTRKEQRSIAHWKRKVKKEKEM